MQDLLPAALAAALRPAPLCDEKVAFAWRFAVGPTVNRVTSARLDGGTLRVIARDAAWRTEIRRSSALIQQRLALVLGPAVVTSITVEDATGSRHSSASPAARPV